MLPSLGCAEYPSSNATTRCLVNGDPVSTIHICDRGLAYGDGLFETLAVRQGSPCCWAEHLDRLVRGAERLKLPLPPLDRLRADVVRVTAGVERGVVKLILTRGPSARGYRPPSAPRPTRICLASEGLPDESDRRPDLGAAVGICRTRLGISPQLAGIKHLNRLEQVLASAELAQGALDEGLMLDAEGFLVCGTMSNLFVLDHVGLHTPLLDRCGVAGTARSAVLLAAKQMGIAIQTRRLPLKDLFAARAAFLTNAVIGVWPVRSVDGRTLDPEQLPWSLIDRVRGRLLQPEAGW